MAWEEHVEKQEGKPGSDKLANDILHFYSSFLSETHNFLYIIAVDE